MDQLTLRDIDALRPVIICEWEQLLRAEPPVSPLANPDTLVYNMGRTLERLLEELKSCGDARWEEVRAAKNTSLCRRCDCGLNPLLCYFSVGEIALHAVLAPVIGVQPVSDVLALFHAIAQEEIEVLCALCRSRQQAPARIVTPARVAPSCRAPAVVFEK